MEALWFWKPVPLGLACSSHVIPTSFERKTMSLYIGRISQEVAALEDELKYYREKYKEQQEIIEQLTGTGKPRGYIYMHPFDFAELINSSKPYEIFDLYRQPSDNIISFRGRNIKQSPHIPAVSKNFS